MQIAVIEFARHVCGLDGANSTEFDPETPYPVIDLLPEQRGVEERGGTMRLGAEPVHLVTGTPRAGRLRRPGRHLRAPPPPLRGQPAIREQLERAGLVVSGRSPDGRLVEIVELPDHPWFCASQFHPEFKSRPTRPQPLFREFVGAAAGHAGARETSARERAALGG